jgi:hypothetical protein
MYRTYSHANGKIQSVDTCEECWEGLAGATTPHILQSTAPMGLGLQEGWILCTQLSQWLEEMLRCSCESGAGGAQVSKQDI